MIYGGMVFSDYNGHRYRLYLEKEIVTLFSLDRDKYQDVVGLRKSDVLCAYRTKVWVRVRDCEALYKGVKAGMVLLDVKPSEDVEILNAKEIDRGVFQAEIPIEEVQAIWEERFAYLDFPFPNELNKLEELDKGELLKP